jgi:hypothetical protein
MVRDGALGHGVGVHEDVGGVCPAKFFRLAYAEEIALDVKRGVADLEGLHLDVENIVEASGSFPFDDLLDELIVEGACPFRMKRADGSNVLADGQVDEVAVTRIEDDPLSVALVESNSQSVNERLGCLLAHRTLLARAK